MPKDIYELVTIEKAGEPKKLRIVRAALEQHEKLGWAVAEDEPEEADDDSGGSKTTSTESTDPKSTGKN